MRCIFLVAGWFAAPALAFADMNLTKPSGWIEYKEEIAQLSSDLKPSMAPIGGRFICSRDEDEDRMVALLIKEGLAVSDSGQCEIVAYKSVSTDQPSAWEAIAYMRQLGDRLGYRLISVESGDFESGNATILASEDGYIPWWQTESDNFKAINEFVRSTMSRADLDAESVEVIGLYLDNREYEMAFEGLFLELIKSGRSIKLNTSECMGMARQLKLDKETAFDYQLWSKFEAFLHDMAK
ncbi:hypothetical protein J2W42_000722 [Rhizobium tibeticum]|uniref:hypothetical protein n=1 Tax=Rhizobium tibeticum TaxID=501024 RepID=UPI0027851F5D|nr:hypothetical protein [Rhizobium tibeticum]MDP9807884.1 hypothetical protein [Rhizobium tibeticum]